MGWCSGTAIFDPVVKKILQLDIPDKDKEGLVKVLMEALQDHDWDCESDSDYWEHPLVKKVFKKAYPHWYEDE